MLGRCTKFRFFNIFNAVVVFCVVNFFLYRFFAAPKSNIPRSNDADSVMNTIRGATPVGGTHIISDAVKNVGNSSLSVLKGHNKLSANVSSTSSSSSAVVKPPTSKVNVTATQTAGNNTSVLPLCALIPPKLNGPLATFSNAVSFAKIAERNHGLQPGGRYKPPDCIARHRVAIVIPYRNREEHLQILLNNLHPMLMRQQLDYGIFVIDQAPPTQFNRAMLMNIGYVEAMKRYGYQCAIFHDVDLIPENDKNIYSCPEMPRHLSAAIDKFRYRLPYAGIYGGVSAVNKEQFEKINGFSNMFFGWGGEDDDMATRIRASGFKITRYPMDIARYRMIKHTKDKGNESNPQRYGLLRTTSKRMHKDGLNSLKYTVQAVDEKPTHVRIQVFIDKDAIMKS